MATDIAALGIQVDSDQVAEANLQLRAMPQAASAAERAVQRMGTASSAAAAQNDNFSKRVRGTIASLDFQRAQLTRTAAEQEKYAAVKKAGVTAESAAGKAIMSAVAALQVQRTATEQASKATSLSAKVTAAAGDAWTKILKVAGPLALALIAVEQAQKAWTAAMGAGDLGELAEKVGLTARELQGLQFVSTQGGASLDDITTAATKFSVKMGEAAEGSKDVVEALKGIGVQNLDVSGKLRPTADLMAEVAQKILAIEDPARRSAAMVSFFGKSGTAMTASLEEMAKGLGNASSQAQRFGALVSDDTIRRIDALSDSMERGKLRMRALAAEGLGFILDQLDKFAASDTAKAMQRAFDMQMKWFGTTLPHAMQDGLDAMRTMLDTFMVKFVDTIGAIPRGLGNLIVKGMNVAIAALETGINAIAGFIKDRLPWLQPGGSATVSIPRLPSFGEAPSVNADGQYTRDYAAETARNRMTARQAAMEQDEAGARRGSRDLPANILTGLNSRGGGTSAAKASGGTDPFKTAAESARDYVAAKRAETAAIGQSAEVAARMKHEQALLNKATSEGKTITAEQTAQLKALAAEMAAADTAFASAKFMDDAVKDSEKFIQTQQIERETLLMSTEAAAAYRYEQELLNKAANDNIVLTEQQRRRIGELAGAMAAQEEQTRRLREIVEFGKETFSGFVSDFTQGLREGASVAEAFGTAMTNALNKIADKLLQMAVDDLWTSAFGGKGSTGGGGFLGGLFGSIFGGGGSVGSPGLPTTPNMGTVNAAKGRVFDHSNVVPFARGGIVRRPTLFPFANGTGLMGEAGPEAIMPLRRGRNGALGVEASGGGGDGGLVVNITNYTDSTVSARKSKGPNGKMNLDVLVEPLEQKLASRLSRGQGALGRTMQGTYGLQNVGR